MTKNISQRSQTNLDAQFRFIHTFARRALTSLMRSRLANRAAMLEAVTGGKHAAPRFLGEAVEVPRHVWTTLEETRRIARSAPAARLYLERLDEFETDLCLLENLGRAKMVKALARRRFGNPDERISGTESLAQRAERILKEEPVSREPHTLSTAQTISRFHRVARWSKLHLSFQVDAHLVSRAAAGSGVVVLQNTPYGERESWRLAVHEVLGHLTANANGKHQPMAILDVGTARSFVDQEGLAVYLEEQAGLMDGHRLRTLAARTWVARAMYEGASFIDTARTLHRTHGFLPTEAVTLCERAWRGGGIGRDVAYLAGWHRVREAVREKRVTVDELRLGKVSIDDIKDLKQLAAAGLVVAPVHRPELPTGFWSEKTGENLTRRLHRPTEFRE